MDPKYGRSAGERAMAHSRASRGKREYDGLPRKRRVPSEASKALIEARKANAKERRRRHLIEDRMLARKLVGSAGKLHERDSVDDAKD